MKVDCYNYNRASFKPKYISECQTGDLVRIKQDEFAPADLLLLNAAAPNESIMIDTSYVNG